MWLPWDKKFPVVGRSPFSTSAQVVEGWCCAELSVSVVISTVCWVAFCLFSAAALWVVFVKTHKKTPE
jgi:hypothetical protein